METLFLNPIDTARELRCSRATVFRMIADGRLPSVAIGRMRRIPRSAILALVNSAEVTS